MVYKGTNRTAASPLGSLCSIRLFRLGDVALLKGLLVAVKCARVTEPIERRVWT